MKKLISLFLFSALLFNLGSSRSIGDFKGTFELKWPNCAEVIGSIAQINQISGSPAFCSSKPFTAEAEAVQIEVSARTKVNITVDRYDTEGGYLPTRIVKARSNNDWNVLQFGPLAKGTEYIVTSSPGVKIKTHVSYFSGMSPARSLLEPYFPLIVTAIFYAPADAYGWDLGVIYKYVSALPAAVLALALTYLIFNLDFKNKYGLYLFFFVTAFFVHYRHDVFFYFDEWTLLNVFQDRSILSYRHNEHYLPLFFSFLMLETKLFGMKYGLYLLLSIAIHSFNAVLLYNIGLNVFERLEKKKLTARIIAVLFLVSSLHSETLHWAFEQSLLICSSLMLLSVLCARKYFASGERKLLILSVLFASLSPFVFGNGFSIPILLFLFWCLDYPKLEYRRLVNLISPIILWFGVCSLFYFSDSNSVVTTLSGRIPRTIAYILSGSQLGVVLRGLGIYPSLELDRASAYVASLPFTIVRDFPEPAIAVLGLIISIVSLLFTYRYRADLLKVWFLGFCLPISSILLPALTRWHYGSAQALSLRYSYLGVCGLFLMLSPCMLMLLVSPKRRLILGLIVAVNIYLQFSLERDFRYFSDYGIKHKAYVQRVIDWKCSKTSDANLIPKHQQSISPGFNQELIYKAVTWLDRNPCE